MGANKMSTRIIGDVAKHKVYVATVTPPSAQELFFVSTYDDKDPMSNAIDSHGYQRPPSSSRFSEIGKYFSNNGNQYLITPLTISVRVNGPEQVDSFIDLFNAGKIGQIKKAFGSHVASIVDGQHRFYGLLDAWGKDSDFLPSIPCIFYFGLSFVEEAELFNTINVSQRKLPKALIETTKGDITENGQNSYAQQIRQLTFSLCRDDDSVWGPKDGKEQINMTGVRDPNRPVTYEGLRRSTSNMFPKELLNRLSAIDEGLPLKYAKRYWQLVSESCYEAWHGIPETKPVIDPETGDTHEMPVKYRIKDLVGIAALAKLGSDIIRTHIDSGDPARLDTLVRKLSDVDWEKRSGNPWMNTHAGFAGQKDLHLMLSSLVYSDAVPESVNILEEILEAQ